MFSLSSLRFASSTIIGREQQKKLVNILNTLIDSPQASQFLHPVAWKELQLDDYLDYVKHPMNLYKVQENLKNKSYETVQEALDHIQLIWDNCKAYNNEGYYFELADKMEKSLKKMIKNYLPNIQLTNQHNKPVNLPTVTPVQPPIKKSTIPIKQLNQSNRMIQGNKMGIKSLKVNQIEPQESQQSENDKDSSSSQQIIQPIIDEIPLGQKNKFYQRLKLITQQDLAQIVLIIQQNCIEGFKTLGGGRYQLVMENIDKDTFKKLNEKVDEYIQNDKSITPGPKKIKS